jgi:hypothetical protein
MYLSKVIFSIDNVLGQMKEISKNYSKYMESYTFVPATGKYFTCETWV